MTVFSSGVSMYALAMLMQLLLGLELPLQPRGSRRVIVLVYIFLGGLTSAIYNEVLQFFLIVLGFLPLVFLGLQDVGGWSGLVAKLNTVAVSQHFAAGHVDRLLAAHGQRRRQPDGRGVVRAWSWGWGSCSRSAIGVPTSWSCSGRWPPIRCRPPGGRR